MGIYLDLLKLRDISRTSQIQKSKVYLAGKQAPQGAKIHTGPRGKPYFLTEELHAARGTEPKKRLPAFRKQEDGSVMHRTKEGEHGPGTYKIKTEGKEHHLTFEGKDGVKSLGKHGDIKELKRMVAKFKGEEKKELNTITTNSSSMTGKNGTKKEPVVPKATAIKEKTDTPTKKPATLKKPAEKKKSNRVVIRTDDRGKFYSKVGGFKWDIEEVNYSGGSKLHIIKNDPSYNIHTMGHRYLAKKVNTWEEVREYLKNYSENNSQSSALKVTESEEKIPIAVKEKKPVESKKDSERGFEVDYRNPMNIFGRR